MNGGWMSDHDIIKALELQIISQNSEIKTLFGYTKQLEEVILEVRKHEDFNYLYEFAKTVHDWHEKHSQLLEQIRNKNISKEG